MTETPAAPSRSWVKYDPPEDTGEVSLPGYLAADPSYVSPGDVFSIDSTYLDEVVAVPDEGDPRFVEVDEPAGDVASPNAKLTRAQLADKLNGDDDPDADPSYTGQETKADLVAAADEYDRTHPEPPSDPDAGDQDPDSTPEGETP